MQLLSAKKLSSKQTIQIAEPPEEEVNIGSKVIVRGNPVYDPYKLNTRLINNNKNIATFHYFCLTKPEFGRYLDRKVDPKPKLKKVKNKGPNLKKSMRFHDPIKSENKLNEKLKNITRKKPTRKIVETSTIVRKTTKISAKIEKVTERNRTLNKFDLLIEESITKKQQTKILHK